MPTPVGTNNIQTSPVSARLLPDEGPKAIPVSLDFTTNQSYVIDLTEVQRRDFISMIQTIFIDLSDPALANVSIDTGVGVQSIVAKGQTQGYYNVMVPNPPKFTVTAAGLGGIARLILINVGIPGAVWPTV